jgi:hypothetical protein
LARQHAFLLAASFAAVVSTASNRAAADQPPTSHALGCKSLSLRVPLRCIELRYCQFTNEIFFFVNICARKVLRGVKAYSFTF